MDINEQREKQVANLQSNLSAIRKIAGWTAEQLGEKIGVTKQTISNLENNRTTMTLTQYIAIRAIIDYEIKNNKENVVLPQVVEILLDKYEDYSEEQQEKIEEKVKIIAATASGGITGAALAAVSIGLFGGIIGGPLAGVVAGTSWLSRILKEKK